MTNYEKLRALADWFDAYDTKRLNPMIGDEVQTDLRAMANEFEQLQHHNVSGALPLDEKSDEFQKANARWGKTHTIQAVAGTTPDLRKLKEGQSVCWGDGKSYHFLLTKRQ